MRRGGAPCLQLSARRWLASAGQESVLQRDRISHLLGFQCSPWSGSEALPRTHKPSTPRERAETRATNGGLANACRHLPLPLDRGKRQTDSFDLGHEPTHPPTLFQAGSASVSPTSQRLTGITSAHRGYGNVLRYASPAECDENLSFFLEAP